MKTNLRKMTALASALVMLSGSIVSGQYDDIFRDTRISAEDAEDDQDPR